MAKTKGRQVAGHVLHSKGAAMMGYLMVLLTTAALGAGAVASEGEVPIDPHSGYVNWTAITFLGVGFLSLISLVVNAQRTHSQALAKINETLLLVVANCAKHQAQHEGGVVTEVHHIDVASNQPEDRKTEARRKRQPAAANHENTGD